MVGKPAYKIRTKKQHRLLKGIEATGRGPAIGCKRAGKNHHWIMILDTLKVSKLTPKNPYEAENRSKERIADVTAPVPRKTLPPVCHHKSRNKIHQIAAKSHNNHQKQGFPGCAGIFRIVKHTLVGQGMGREGNKRLSASRMHDCRQTRNTHHTNVRRSYWIGAAAKNGKMQ